MTNSQMKKCKHKFISIIQTFNNFHLLYELRSKELNPLLSTITFDEETGLIQSVQAIVTVWILKDNGIQVQYGS